MHQKVVYAYVSLSFSCSTVAALAVSLSRRQNGKSCDGSEEERARAWRENGEDRT